MRTSLALVAIIPVAAVLLFFAISSQYSFSASQTNMATELLSSSQQTTIKIAGDASKSVAPDQVSLSLSLQTIPGPLDVTTAESKKLTQTVSDAISAALGEEAKVQVGQMYINPTHYGGAPADSATFSAYSSVQIKTDLDHYNTLSTKLADAGFRVEGISIREVSVEKPVGGPAQTVSIPFGSSNPSNSEFFLPKSITVLAGTTIQWTNDDSAAHTVTSGPPGNPDGLFDSSLLMPGGVFEHSFDTEGIIPYFCLVHPWAEGEVMVTNEAGETTPKETTHQVTMNVIVETTPDTLQNAIEASQQKIEKLNQVLDESGLSSENIKSNQINFNQIYYGTPLASTYSAYTRIVVNTSMENMDAVISAAKMPGVNVENMAFSVSDHTLDELRKELTQQALENALERAKEISGPAGLEVKSIKGIEVVPSQNQAQYHPVMSYRGVSVMYDGTVYQAGTISVSVVAEFELGK